MMNILNELHIEFESEYPIYFCHTWKVYDMRIGDSILIEVDGDYWHGNPEKAKVSQFHLLKNKKNDLMKDFIAKKNGFNLLRFWESDVHNAKDLVVKRLLEAIKEVKEVI